MRAIIFIGLCLVALTNGESIHITPSKSANSNLVQLVPKTGVFKNVFNLRAPSGSKMVVVCSFKKPSCNNTKIIIDTGLEVTEHCPEEEQYVFKNSFKNRMNVTIESKGKTMGAYCQVEATKPYIDMLKSQIEIDSSEHGRPHKSLRATSCRCGWTNKSPRRIVGGTEAGINEYPFLALLVFAEDRFPFCGGSIITPYHILTAAHCTYKYLDRNLAVLVGEHDIRTNKETSATRMHMVSRIYQHEGYRNTTYSDDIAILELANKIEFNDRVGPVCMPMAKKSLQDQFVKVMGWGLLNDAREGGKASPKLHKVDLRIINPLICKAIYKINTTNLKQRCTYNDNKDSCQGDSGGPLVSLNPETNMYEQVALVSYGRKCGSTDPAVNTDVFAYLPWINAQISKSNRVLDLCS